jgi:hypothetical protein
MSYPVHEERLDHSCDTNGTPLRLLPPRDVAHGQSLHLSCHSDYLLGQASNGACSARPASDASTACTAIGTCACGLERLEHVAD